VIARVFSGRKKPRYGKIEMFYDLLLKPLLYLPGGRGAVCRLYVPLFLVTSFFVE